MAIFNEAFVSNSFFFYPLYVVSNTLFK